MAFGTCTSRALPLAALVTAAALSLGLLAGCGGAGLSATSTAPAEALAINAAESAHLRRGMRAFLESVEGVTSGIAGNDMRAVARAAKRSGWSMMDATATATALKLPPEFVAVSIDTHQKFDDLAAAAAAGATKSQVLSRLAGILSNCTSCHAAYRLADR